MSTALKIENKAKKIFEQYLAENKNSYEVDENNSDNNSKIENNQSIFEYLSSSEAVLDVLNKVDWSFAENNTGYLSHDIHPYPAKFIPQIPETVINKLSARGELVWDPFGGCGTTALEAVLNNRRCISTDINPIGEIIGKAKTTTVSVSQESEMIRFIERIETMRSEVDNLQSYIEKNQEDISKQIPEIPNLNKWFAPNAVIELALIKHLINTQLTTDETKTIAKASLSKIITKVSNQESETRYCAVEKEVKIGQTISAYISDLKMNFGKIKSLGELLSYRTSQFHTADVMSEIVGENKLIKESSVDLIVTSPPYPNAFDYHLYHRFRIFWLGGDPRIMGKKEIGSHLRHQKEKTGFDNFVSEMKLAVTNFYTALKPGRYAVLVLGDAIFKGDLFHTAKEIGEMSKEVGFEVVGIIDRPLHETKRSMQNGARRAKDEQILIIKKPEERVRVKLNTAPYRLWDYEEVIKTIELRSLVSDFRQINDSEIEISPYDLNKLKRLTFYHGFSVNDSNFESTWQSIIENGDAKESAVSRKDPKYITHGIHPYKGKFYPQLVKPLLNISKAEPGSVVFDPFCGSGTVALEGLLNGYKAYGCDVNPIAVEIAKAKTEILSVDPSVLEKTLEEFHTRLRKAPVSEKYIDTFSEDSIEEISSWFPSPVVQKMGWILAEIEEVPDVRIQRFLNVILSSIIRDISQQEPTDLRIRRRKEPIEDAPVYELFSANLTEQKDRILNFAKIKHHAPFEFIEPTIWSGNSTDKSIFVEHLKENSVDTVITSPPYATALPYIDTNRLSLLVLQGKTSKKRKTIEAELTGTREITKTVRLEFEQKIDDGDFEDIISEEAIGLINKVLKENRNSDVGFRRKNMGALLYMYYNDMGKVFKNIDKAVKKGGHIFIVIGDNKTTTAEEEVIINTGDILREYGKNLGWKLSEDILINVTTEDYKHIGNAIKENAILCFTK
jgi:DNA modification methylase